MTYTDQHNKSIQLGKELSSGNEGTVYLLKGNNTDVAKIFKPEKRQAKHKKVEFMIGHSPLVNAPSAVQKFIAWPISALFENGSFCGYTMPLIQDAQKLTILTKPTIRSIHKRAYSKFEHGTKKAETARLTVCQNLAVALDTLHSTGHYVYGDIKPDNLMVNTKGIISLIDLDSIQINRGSFKQNADALTIDYTPNEFYGMPSKTMLKPTWDYFSYAITAYQVLVGCLPFAGKLTGVDNMLPSELIKKGLYPMGKNRSKFGKNMAHQKLLKLSKNLQYQFELCFDEGHTNPSKRPNLRSWYDILELEMSAQIHKDLKLIFRVDQNRIQEGDSTELYWDIDSRVKKIAVDGKNVGNTFKMRVSPTKTQDYTLSYKWGLRSYKIVLKVDVVSKPKINTFVTDVEYGKKGDTVTVYWDVVNVSVLNINSIGSNLPFKGSHKFRLAKDELLSLEAIGIGSPIILKRSVQMLRKDEFQISKKDVEIGESVELKWDLDNRVKDVKLNSNPVAVLQSIKVSPVKSIVYALTYQWGKKNYKIERSVQVYPKPIIRNFQSSVYDAVQGDVATLTWDVENTKEVILLPFNKKVSAKGSHTFTLKKSQTISLKATNYGIPISKQITITAVKTPDFKLYFSRDPIYIGETSELIWDFPEAKKVEITPDIGSVNRSGSFEVESMQDITYKAIIHWKDRKVEKVVHLKVIPEEHKEANSAKSLLKETAPLLKETKSLLEETKPFSFINKLINRK